MRRLLRIARDRERMRQELVKVAELKLAEDEAGPNLNLKNDHGEAGSSADTNSKVGEKTTQKPTKGNARSKKESN